MNDRKKSERGRSGGILRTEADAEAASELNRSAALEDFMRRADDLFPTDAGPCGCLVLAAGFRRRKDALRTGKVSVWPREDDEGVCLAIQRALELPRELKYPHVALRPDGRVEVEEGWFFPHEARQIAELRAAIHGYCAAAMAFAAKNRYASAALWRALESDLHGRLALPVEETPPSAKETVIRFLDAQRRLADDVRQAEMTRTKAAEAPRPDVEPARPYERFRFRITPGRTETQIEDLRKPAIYRLSTRSAAWRIVEMMLRHPEKAYNAVPRGGAPWRKAFQKRRNGDAVAPERLPRCAGTAARAERTRAPSGDGRGGPDRIPVETETNPRSILVPLPRTDRLSAPAMKIPGRRQSLFGVAREGVDLV